MVQRLLEPFGMTALTAEKGVNGLAPGSPAVYACIATLHFNSVDELHRGLAAHGPEIIADIPKYTDAQPAIQISEVLL